MREKAWGERDDVRQRRVLATSICGDRCRRRCMRIGASEARGNGLVDRGRDLIPPRATGAWDTPRAVAKAGVGGTLDAKRVGPSGSKSVDDGGEREQVVLLVSCPGDDVQPREIEVCRFGWASSGGVRCDHGAAVSTGAGVCVRLVWALAGARACGSRARAGRAGVRSRWAASSWPMASRVRRRRRAAATRAPGAGTRRSARRPAAGWGRCRGRRGRFCGR